MATTKKSSTKPLKKEVTPKEETQVENLGKTNKEVITQQVIINRELKYIYPKGCIDTLKRKAYRQKVRNAISKLEGKIVQAKGEDRRKFKEELDVYKVEHTTGK